MESSLHRQLKASYAEGDARQEVTLGQYRIDVVRDDQLIEIQHGSLAAIRNKIGKLVKKHEVLVVKPIVVRKLLVKQNVKGGKILERRFSPKQGRLLDLFDDLVYFTRVFPHRNLQLEAVLIDVEEWRYPGHGRRRRRRRRDHEVEDQKLVQIRERRRLRSSADLRALLDCELPNPFHTGHLADALSVNRWIAQRIAYCLRNVGTARLTGKQGNTLLYEFAEA